MAVKYFIGTAGWSYRDWVPVFYPKNQNAEFDWLRFYSHYFNCVEVNSTYYSFISPKVVDGWVDKVSDSDDFRFTIKLHQDFTHKRNYDQQKIKAVCFNLDLLSKAERLGGVLIQFPYSFQFSASASEYLGRIKDIFQSYKLFIEVRHSSWNSQQASNLLKKNDLTFCTIDQPQIGSTIEFEPIITNKRAYLRFHGRNVSAWQSSLNNFGKELTYRQQNERYNYLYAPGELAEIQQQIKSVSEKVKEVYVIMNNHPGGNAVANAFELIQLLEETRKVEIPRTIIKAYSRLEVPTQK